jgi:ribose-phosphate pyrophosphokinase
MHSSLVIGQNSGLGLAIAQACGARMMLPVYTFKTRHFSDTEFTVILPDVAIRNSKVMVTYAFVSCNDGYSSQLMELLFLLHTINALLPSSIELVIPYLPYSRHDVDGVINEGHTNKIAWLLKLFAAHGVTRCFTLDMHNHNAVSIDCVESISMVPEWSSCLQQAYAQVLDNKQLVLVAPDQGSLPRVALLAELFSLPVVSMQKRRLPGTLMFEALDVSVIAGKHVVIIDDMCVTGDTIRGALVLLKQHNPKSVAFFVTHILSKSSLEALCQDYAIQVYSTNSCIKDFARAEKVIQVETIIAEYLANHTKK